MTNNNFDNMTIEELKVFLKISEEKNQNLAKLLKDKSVESKNLKAEIDKQYELIGKLVEEKK